MLERGPVAHVEVAYGTAQRQSLIELPWRAGLTAGEAVEASGLLEEYPEILERPLVLGIFGARVERDRVLEAGDRVEICRPLIQDPRDMRREALARGGVIGRPAGSAKN
ncbi:MAG TPA: RnfH family protein [Gammaproteobacteria bacterium]|jgi:hypothetical protein